LSGERKEEGQASGPIAQKTKNGSTPREGGEWQRKRGETLRSMASLVMAEAPGRKGIATFEQRGEMGHYCNEKRKKKQKRRGLELREGQGVDRTRSLGESHERNGREISTVLETCLTTGKHRRLKEEKGDAYLKPG